MGLKIVIGLIVLGFYLLGIACGVASLWRSRTPQGATAWVMSLISFPFIFIPLFLIFGRNKFFGYVKKRQFLDTQSKDQINKIRECILFDDTGESKLDILKPILHQTTQQGFTDKNKVELLIDGEQTYKSMLEAIDKAQKYILFQFYIFRYDKAGAEFIDALCKKSKEGIKVYFIYDGVGSVVAKKALKKLDECGVLVYRFENRKYFTNRFQVNFRNHRKIIVVDGKSSYIGGLNIGDEYLGRSKYGFWRDTHLKIVGPATMSAQLSFIKDWYWASGYLPEDLNWTDFETKDGDAKMMVIHTGPADNVEACLLTHLALINTAKKRIWLSSPYFLPSEGLMNALSYAVLRGVDVRVIIPSSNDSHLVQYASQAYQEKMLKDGVKVYSYKKGFTHQKTMLVDDEFAVIGTANLDARSLFINFEITSIIENNQKLNKQMEMMFLKDFHDSKELSIQDFKNHTFTHKTLVRAANLLSPIL